MGERAEYTREALIALCEASLVPHGEWSDRRSSGHQRETGELWALLRDGCPFEAEPWPDGRYVAVGVTFCGWTCQESGEPPETAWFKLPTPARRAELAEWGPDW